jgi:hypothetical protein
MKIQTSEELAYWIGVVQSDGSFKKYLKKDRGRFRYEISLGVSHQSLPMLKKFQKLSKKIFNRNAKIFKLRNKNRWDFAIGIQSLLDTFKNLDIKFSDPPVPTKWVTENLLLFGAYLAGIIDGDGSIRIKRKKYPQCMVKITSGKSQNELANSIRNFLNCAVSITPYRGDRMLNGKIITGKWYELEFLVSSKNYKFVSSYILPNLTIVHKKEILEECIAEKLGM